MSDTDRLLRELRHDTDRLSELLDPPGFLPDRTREEVIGLADRVTRTFRDLDRVLARRGAWGADLVVDDETAAAALEGKTVALDFDGVLHSYTSGWTGPVPVDPPVEGAAAFCRALIRYGAHPVVVTTRAATREGQEATVAYLARHGFPKMNVTPYKVAAVGYVDDRGVSHVPGDPWERTLTAIVRLANPDYTSTGRS